MLVIAAIGLLANIIGLIALAQPTKNSVNVKGAYLHVLVDAAGSVAVIVSAFVIAATGWVIVDSIVSLVIAAMIVPRAWALMKLCFGILMEHTPEHTDVTHIHADLLALNYVQEVHDLHVWSVTGTETL